MKKGFALPLIIALIFVVGTLGVITYFIFFKTPKPQPTIVNSQTLNTNSDGQPTQTNEDFQKLADKLFISVKDNNINSYNSLASNYLKETDKRLNRKLETEKLSEAISQKQTTITNIQNCSFDNAKMPCIYYQGQITYSSTPTQSRLDVTFINENGNWKVQDYSILEREITKSSKDIRSDLLGIESVVKYKLFMPTKLPSGYIYQTSRSDVQAGSSYSEVFVTFLNKTSNTDIQIYETNFGGKNVQIKHGKDSYDINTLNGKTIYSVNPNNNAKELTIGKENLYILISSSTATKEDLELVGKSLIIVN